MVSSQGSGYFFLGGGGGRILYEISQSSWKQKPIDLGSCMKTTQPNHQREENSRRSGWWIWFLISLMSQSAWMPTIWQQQFTHWILFGSFLLTIREGLYATWNPHLCLRNVGLFNLWPLWKRKVPRTKWSWSLLGFHRMNGKAFFVSPPSRVASAALVEHSWQLACNWWFKVTFLGWVSDLFKRLSDLQLGDKKATLNHLALNISWDQNLLDFESWTTRTLTKNMKPL